MNKFAPIALAATTALLAGVPSAVFAAETTQPDQAAAEEVASAIDVDRGAMLYSADGNRIGKVYRLNADGDPQLILSGRLITVPASTLSVVDGKVTTSMAKREIRSAK